MHEGKDIPPQEETDDTRLRFVDKMVKDTKPTLDDPAAKDWINGERAQAILDKTLAEQQRIEDSRPKPKAVPNPPPQSPREAPKG